MRCTSSCPTPTRSSAKPPPRPSNAPTPAGWSKEGSPAKAQRRKERGKEKQTGDLLFLQSSLRSFFASLRLGGRFSYYFPTSQGVRSGRRDSSWWRQKA